jgi:hypothetical protein
VKPLEANVVTDFNVFDELSSCYYDTGTFVTANKGHLRFKGPVAIDGVKVCVADSTILDVD